MDTRKIGGYFGIQLVKDLEAGECSDGSDLRQYLLENLDCNFRNGSIAQQKKAIPTAFRILGKYISQSKGTIISFAAMLPLLFSKLKGRGKTGKLYYTIIILESKHNHR
jgi:hypothetical protein